MEVGIARANAPNAVLAHEYRRMSIVQKVSG
jgi:hypothetical protein